MFLFSRDVWKSEFNNFVFLRDEIARLRIDDDGDDTDTARSSPSRRLSSRRRIRPLPLPSRRPPSVVRWRHAFTKGQYASIRRADRTRYPGILRVKTPRIVAIEYVIVGNHQITRVTGWLPEDQELFSQCPRETCAQVRAHLIRYDCDSVCD